MTEKIQEKEHEIAQQPEQASVLGEQSYRHWNTYKQTYNATWAEDVRFDGEEIVEVTVTPEQAKVYQETGYFTYTIDNQKLTEKFLEYVNRLRSINGIQAQLTTSQEAVTYAQDRANEMKKNQQLSHNSQLAKPKNYGIENVSSELIRKLTINGLPIETVKQSPDGKRVDYYNLDHHTNPKTHNSQGQELVSHESLAYFLALRWYSEFGNKFQKDYGHRLNLLTATGNAAVAMSNTPAARPTDQNYYAYVAQFLNPTEGENIKASIHAKPGGTPVTINGQPMKFLPNMTFKYVVRGSTKPLQQELSALKEQQMRAQQVQTTLNNTQKRLEQDLKTIQQTANATSDKRKELQAQLDKVKEVVATLDQQIVKQEQDFQQKTNQLTAAMAVVEKVQVKVNQLSQELQLAEAKKEKAQSLKD